MDRKEFSAGQWFGFVIALIILDEPLWQYQYLTVLQREQNSSVSVWPYFSIDF